MFKEKILQTPNISKGRIIIPEGIILHHSAGTYKGDINWCMDPKSQVSYHAVVNTDGERTILAKDTQRAWHAGKSLFKDKPDCNSFMLGISVTGDTSKRELTKEEAISVAEWCVNKMKLYSFGLNEITTHSKVSPGRKTDVDTRAYEAIMFEIKEILNLNC